MSSSPFDRELPPGAEQPPTTNLSDRYRSLPQDQTTINGFNEPEEEEAAPTISRQARREQSVRNRTEPKAEPAPRMHRPEFSLEKTARPPEKVAQAAAAPPPTPQQVRSVTPPAAASYVAPVFDGTEQGWTRVQLPSRCVPYSFADVKTRPLEVPDLAALYASIDNRSDTMFYDALDAAVDVDIRDLTAEDFKFLMYWWRLNSFSRSPYKFDWNSRYNNANTTTIFNETDLEIIELQMSPEEYREFQAQGIVFPTLRDAEYQKEVNFKGQERFLAERAQYIHTEETGDRWYPSRFERLSAPGQVRLLETVRDFTTKIRHGVVERVPVKDEHYEPVKAAAALRQSALSLTRLLALLPENEVSPEVLFNNTARIEDLIGEAEQIEAVLEEAATLETAAAQALRETLGPREEVITLNISVMDFFPAI